MLEILLSEHSADENANTTMTLFHPEALDGFGRTALQACCACENADPESVEMMLDYAHHFRNESEEMQFHVNAIDRQGMSALMYAIKNDHADVVQELFAHKAQGHHPDPDVANQEYFGFTSLHYACQSKDERTEIVRALCQNRAELNSTDDFGFTPLHLASMNGHLQIVKILFNYNTNASAVTEKDDVYISDRDDRRYGMRARHGGDTALHLAAAYGHINLVVFLIKKGAEANAENVSLERTPLHHAFETLAALDRLCEELEEDLQECVSESMSQLQYRLNPQIMNFQLKEAARALMMMLSTPRK